MKKNSPFNIGIHSASKSSPLVDEDGIFVGSDNSWFFALDHDLKQLWKYYTSGAPRGIHGSAATDQNSVYFGSYNGYVYRLRKTDGSLIWGTKLLNASGCSPRLVDEQVFICSESGFDGYLVSLNRQSGAINWKSTYFGEQVHSTPTVDLKNRQVVIGTNKSELIAFDMDMGSVKWKFKDSGAIKGTAYIFENEICFTSWGKTLTCLDLLSGQKTGQMTLEGSSQSSPQSCSRDDRVFFLSSSGQNQTINLYAVDLRKKTILWRQSYQNAGKATSSVLPICDQNKKTLQVITPCQNKSVCLVDAQTGKSVDSLQLGFVVSSVPQKWGSALYITSDEGPLFKLNLL